jgi:hypothetical protein
MSRNVEKTVSLAFFWKPALFGWLALLPIGAALSRPAPAEPAITANDLVRAVVANELQTQDESHNRWMYRVDKQERGKTKAKEVVQTAHGSLDRLVAVDGRPLNAKEQQDEIQRIENLLRNPAEQKRQEQTNRKDAEQCRALFKMIPDALTFSYAGREENLMKLDFRPNPNFQPPSREARVFHEMEGEMWIDEAQRRLARIKGRLIGDVKFAGGLLGYLEKGGQFHVEQREVVPQQWELTLLEVEMKGRALLFKTIAVQQQEFRSDFRMVREDLTLPEAADLLTKQVVVAANR